MNNGKHIFLYKNSVGDERAIAILLLKETGINISSWAKYLIEKNTSKCTLKVS